MSPPLDPQARKQLLLTRIAIERAEWVQDVHAVRRQLAPAQLLSAWLHRSGRQPWASALFGAGGAAAPSGWVGRLVETALTLRRHPLWWPLIAGVLPWWRSRSGPAPRRAGSSRWWWAAVGLAAGAGAWWASRQRTPPGSDQGL